MGEGETGWKIHAVRDNLYVTRRFASPRPRQCGFELAEGVDLRREPAPAAESGGKVMVLPRGEVVVDPVGVLFEPRSIIYPSLLRTKMIGFKPLRPIVPTSAAVIWWPPSPVKRIRARGGVGDRDAQGRAGRPSD